MTVHIYGDSFWVQQALEQEKAGVVFHGDDPEDLKRFQEYTASDGLFGDPRPVAIIAAKKMAIKADKTIHAKPMADWARSYVGKHGYTIEKKAEEELMIFKDAWRIKNELDKAMNYCVTKKITVQDVYAVISVSPKLNIFRFVDAVAQKRKAEAIMQLQAHMEAGTDLFYLHSMLVWKARKVISGDLIIKLHDAELNVKNGIVPMDNALWNLVLGI